MAPLNKPTIDLSQEMKLIYINYNKLFLDAHR